MRAANFVAKSHLRWTKSVRERERERSVCVYVRDASSAIAKAHARRKGL